MVNFLCKTLEQTEKAAKYFLKYVEPGVCFCLYGDLGAGKTAFSEFLIKSLNPNIKNVTSPTFNIIQTYECEISEIWHVDCYRLKSEDEIYELGLQEAIGQFITIIEWPEIIENFLPENAIKIYFKMNGEDRIIESDF